MPFAIIQTGGKQYRVSPGQKVKIEKIDSEKESPFVFDKVLLVAEGEAIKIGEPKAIRAPLIEVSAK